MHLSSVSSAEARHQIDMCMHPAGRNSHGWRDGRERTEKNETTGAMEPQRIFHSRGHTNTIQGAPQNHTVQGQNYCLWEMTGLHQILLAQLLAFIPSQAKSGLHSGPFPSWISCRCCGCVVVGVSSTRLDHPLSGGARKLDSTTALKDKTSEPTRVSRCVICFIGIHGIYLRKNWLLVARRQPTHVNLSNNM